MDSTQHLEFTAYADHGVPPIPGPAPSAPYPDAGAVAENGATVVAASRQRSVDGIAAAAPVPRMTVSLVIPTKNEARNLAWVLGEVPTGIDEVVLVDGDSVDVTRLMAVTCRPDIRIVGQTGPGKGNALRAGFQAATGDVIVMLDADGSMSPREIPHYLHFLEHGYDFVKGSRFMAGGGSLDITAFRRAGNWALIQLVNSLYSTNLTDLCYGFCAFHRRYLEYLNLTADGFDIEAQMTISALRAGLRIAEVPSLELPRRSGKSNLHAIRDGNLVLRTILRDVDTAPVANLMRPVRYAARQRRGAAGHSHA